jgi:hypothetical protein
VQVSVLAHSFGTLVASRIICESASAFSSVVFAASVLPRQTESWQPLITKVGSQNLRNDCIRSDIWPCLAELFGRGVGASGTEGGPLCLNYFHELQDHSDYLDERFVERYWYPFLIEGRLREVPDRTGGPAARLPRIILGLARWRLLIGWLLVACALLGGAWIVLSGRLG